MDIEKAMKNIESVLNKSNEGLGILFDYFTKIVCLGKKPLGRPES